MDNDPVKKPKVRSKTEKENFEKVFWDTMYKGTYVRTQSKEPSRRDLHRAKIRGKK